MSFTPMIFANKIPTAKSHQAFLHGLATDGIICGCDVTSSGFTVTIGAGYINCGGAEVQAVGDTTIEIENANSGYARVKGVVDLTKSDSSDNFKQFQLDFDTATTISGFPELTQEDFISGSGTKYECVLALCTLGTDGITNIVPYPAQAKIAYGDTLPSTAAEGQIFLKRIS